MSLIGGVTNIVLAYVFIALFDMGIAGAGLATLIGMALAVLKFKLSKIDFSVIRETVFNGSSEMVSELAVGFIALIFNMLMIQKVGEDGVVAVSVILYINSFIAVMITGFSMVVAPIISFFVGANEKQGLEKVLSYARKTLTVPSVVLVAFVFIFKSVFVSAYFDGSSDIYNTAVEGLSIFCITFLFTGSNMYGSALYTAFGNGKVSAFISFSKTFVIFTLSAFGLPNVLDVTGIWIIVPVTEILTAIIVVSLTNKSKISKMIKSKLSLQTA